MLKYFVHINFVYGRMFVFKMSCYLFVISYLFSMSYFYLYFQYFVIVYLSSFILRYYFSILFLVIILFQFFLFVVGDAPFCPDYLFYFNVHGTLGPFMSRFEFGPRTYFVMWFIYFMESLSNFVLIIILCLIFVGVVSC